jgi:hypothetical protein
LKTHGAIPAEEGKCKEIQYQRSQASALKFPVTDKVLALDIFLVWLSSLSQFKKTSISLSLFVVLSCASSF